MTQFETEIAAIKNEVINMWRLVRSQLMKAYEALITNNKDLAHEVMAMEKRVNALELKIDRDCENIFALHCPVAIDLRFLLAVLKINNNLERIGDIADGIARYIAEDRKSTRLNSSHPSISYAVFCLKKKKKKTSYIITQATI